MIKKPRVILAIIGMLCYLSTSAQVAIFPTYQNIETFRIDQLFQVSLVNSGTNAVLGVLEVSVEGKNSQPVLKLSSNQIRLEGGAMVANEQIPWNTRLEFGSSQESSFLKSTGKLQFGEYVFCYSFISNGTALGVNCQEQTINLYGLPELLSPINDENIQTSLPILTWKPPFPLDIPNLHYSLRLTEFKPGQSPAEALKVNYPLLQTHHLENLLLPYPGDAYPLEEGKSYVWQVTAHTGPLEIGKTDIWVFHYNQRETVLTSKEQPTKPESYRFVKTSLDGSYYQANQDIYFAYDNRYHEATLNYTIICQSQEHKALQILPIIELQPGINKIRLEGETISELSEEASYLLQVTNAKGKHFYFPFYYRPTKAQ